jgi:hypothetical protein
MAIRSPSPSQDDARSPGRRRPASARTARGGRSLLRALTGGGAEGNEELTAATGVLLLILLAVLGVTILRIRPLLSVHMFLGLLLIPPVLLKMASTGYRFIRYYAHNPEYRSKGPPAAIMRASAPVLVLLSVVVFASGVALLLIGPSSRGALLGIHKASFIVWIGFTGLHVIGHLPDLARTLSARQESRSERREDLNGRTGRFISLTGALALGVVIAILLLPEFAAWLHAHRDFGSR